MYFILLFITAWVVVKVVQFHNCVIVVITKPNSVDAVIIGIETVIVVSGVILVVLVKSI